MPGARSSYHIIQKRVVVTFISIAGPHPRTCLAEVLAGRLLELAELSTI
jgi:hypothetical protein